MLPVSAASSSRVTSRSRKMKETVSGVLAGVSPKATAPGSAATLIPEGTGSGAFGAGAEAAAGPASAASGKMSAATPKAAPAADRRAVLVRIMSCAPVGVLAAVRRGENEENPGRAPEGHGPG